MKTTRSNKMTSEEQKAYECDCIENGERFVCTFKSKTTKKEELYKIGVQLASGWGAECISVKKIIPYSDEPMENIFDVDNEPSWKLFFKQMTKMEMEQQNDI